MLPAVGLIQQFSKLTLRLLGVLEIGHDLFHKRFDSRLHTRVAGKANHIAELLALTKIVQRGRGKATVGSDFNV